MMELQIANTYQFQQETQMRIRRMEDQICLLPSTVSQLIPPSCEKLPSQTIINLEKNESAVILTNDEELQEFQEEGSNDVVEKEVEKMKPQSQITIVNEFNE